MSLIGLLILCLVANSSCAILSIGSREHRDPDHSHTNYSGDSNNTESRNNTVEEVEMNDRPIIGVLSQEMSRSLIPLLPDDGNYTSYIAASYVKYVEAAGARVAPVIIGREREYYQQLFENLNGLLIPGGGTSIYSSGYASTGKIFYELALEANLAGDFFPIWGTCLGFELLALLANDEEPYLKRCNSYPQSLPLDLVSGWQNSRLYGEAPSDVMDHLTNLPVTANFHHWCLTMENFTKYEMGNFWDVLSVNTDTDGLEFISTLEAKNFPIFGTQWHPEKNPYEWTPKYPDLPHSKEAVKVSFYMAEFFVSKARRSLHSFPSRSSEEETLIYNHQPLLTGNEEGNSVFEQVYIF